MTEDARNQQSTVFERLGRDVRYAARTLRREPTFVAGVVLTFALAIGANAAMFGLVTRLMLSPPPGITDAEHVAKIRLAFISDDGDSFVGSSTSYPTFRTLHAQRGAFAAVAATRSDTVNVGRTPNIEQLAIVGASGDYFAVLGVTPIVGRFFGPADDEPPSGSPVIVIGYAYWQRTFAGDRAVLGREVIIDDRPFTIIGVAPRGFNGDGLGAIDAFMPLSTTLRNSGNDWVTNRFLNIVSVIVRLRNDVAPVVARQMASAAVREDASAAGRSRTPAIELEPIIPGRASRQSPQAQIAIWLSAVSVIVLLIAAANVGTLLSLRSARRRREIAVRIAMGAGHADLARQLLVESLMLAAIGAVVGLLLSRWFSDVVRVTLLPTLASTETFVDRRVLVASVVAAALAGIIAGLAPLAQVGGTNLSAQLRSGGGHGASGRLAFQNTLVSIQVALCTLLLVGASLFVRSLQRVQSQDLGFSTAKLVWMTLEFRGYITGAERDLAYYDAVERVRGVAGVGSATVVAGIPFGPHNIPPVSVPGMAKPFGPGSNVQIPVMYGATPDYLKMMDVALIGGRLLTERDGRGAPKVLLVNESMARYIWPGQSALGKCVRIGFAGGGFPSAEGGNPADGAPCREVVGVVRDSRARSLRPEHNEDRIMQYYVPFEQLPDSPMPDPSHVMGMMVRVTGDLDRTSALMQRTIHATSAVPLYAHARPYQDLIDPQLRSWRLGATLFSAFSMLALGIAAVGLFGVVSFVVTQRTQEIGVRLALGETSRGVTRLVVSDALRMVSIGVGVGVIGAIAAGPIIASLLFQTSPREPASIVVAGLVLMAATLAAAAWPAWRAGRVNPVVALRADG
jgi:predicted permease